MKSTPLDRPRVSPVLRFSAALVLASLGAAHAATYVYTPTNSVGDLWSTGVGWDATPVSATDTALVFGPAGAYTDGVAITNTNTNDIGTFSLNSLTLQGAGPLTAGFPVAVTITGGTLDFGGTSPQINLTATNGGSPVAYSVNSNINLSAATTITGGGNATFNFGGVISGSNDLVKSGASVVTLSGANTYTGNTAINGGTIKISAANNLGDGSATNTISFSGGTLNSTAGTYNLGTNRTVTLNSQGLVQVDAGALTIDGNASGSGFGFNKSGAGTLVLSGTNTNTGASSLNAGTLKLGSTSGLGTAAASLSMAGGTTLDLATDSSVNAYNVTLTGGATILSNKATASSAGITQTLGTLSLPAAATLNIQAGANVFGGTPIIAFGATTVGSGVTFNPTTASLVMSSVTGTNASITLGGTATSNSVGNINIGTGTVTKSGASKWIMTGSGGTYSGTTTLSGGTLEIAADSVGTPGSLTSGPLGTGILSLGAGTTIQSSSSGAHSIGNEIYLSANGPTIAGTQALTLAGAMSTRTSGITVTVNNTALTTFSGVFGIRGDSTGTNRSVTFNGTGNILFSNAITDGITGTSGSNLTYTGTGTVTLAGANTFSGTAAYTGSGFGTILGGNLSTVVLDATSGGSGTSSGNITVGNGTNNARLLIKGNYNLGMGAPTKTLTIQGGNGTSTGQGMLSLQDGTKNTFTITNTNTAANNTLVFDNGASGSILAMDVGGGGADSIVLAGSPGGRLRINTAGGIVTVNLNGIGNLVAGTYQLISGPNASSLNGGSFVAGTTTGNFGGYTSVSLSATTSGLQLVLGGLTAAPATAYWAGDVDSSWNTFTGGTANNTNWATDIGGTNSMQIPDSTSDVIFSVTSPANTTTTLGQAFSVKSLTFNNTSGAVTIGGGNALTVGTGGITSNSGAGAVTINSPVTIASSQTWTNDSSNDLTVAGAVTSSTGITKAGTGALVLSGNNTALTGGLTINDGAVRVASAGALNSGTPQAVTFGASAPSTAKFQANGNSITIGALSTNATPGTPVVENANASAATLTISQTSNTTYAGTVQDGTGGGALSIVKTGSGTLTFSGNNSYTGTTAVNGGTLLVNGNSSSATGAVSVGSATLGGTGTVGGAITVSGTGTITGADIGTVGTLNAAGGLSISSGGVAYFDINDNSTYDSINITGNLSLVSGAIIKVPASLTTTTTYDLFTYTGTGPADLSGVIFQSQGGGALPGTYGFSIFGSNTIRLTITGATTAIPTINITSPVGGTRVMANTSVNIAGNIGNTGVVDLHGTLSDNSGQLTVSNFNPSGAATVAPSGSQGYTATIADTGTTLGSRTYSVKVSDPDASPTSTSANSTLDVLGNRTVNASTVNYGNVHINATASGNTSMTSTGADDQYTRVTVANGTNGAFTVSGGTNPTFNGSTSDTRTVSGAFTGLGVQNGTVTLTTTGEGLSGESPIDVPVDYNATVFSGTAAWASTASGSWATQSNWGDTNVGNLGVAGSPGLDGSASIGDTATFGDVGGGASTTVSLNGANPSLAALTFTGTTTSYTVATGSAGTISLQNAATPVAVTGTHTISAVLGGTGGLAKSGTGTLTLSGANTYAGATSINNGTVQLIGGNDRLPNTTSLTIGSGANSGKLILGNASGAVNQTVTGLQTSGSGLVNTIVGGNSSVSTLTVNIASGTNTFGGVLGGAGTNEFNLALNKTGTGTLVLTQSPAYTGTTTVSSGVLQVPSANSLLGFITFGSSSVANAGVLQTNGTLTRTLSTTASASNLNWASFNGFAAKGGSLTLTFNGGAGLTWASNGFMGTGGATMIFGSTSADSQVVLTNNVNLSTADGFVRPIYVESGVGGDSAKLAGVISPGVGTSGISKQGNGTLILAGNNTYTGATNILVGTVKLENPNGLGYQTNVPILANGGATPGVTTVSTGAVLDLNGQAGVLESITLNGNGVGNGGALINSNTGTPASIDIGLTQLGIQTVGAGYNFGDVQITGGGGTGATGTATFNPGLGVASITLTDPGTGYVTAPTVSIINTDGTGAVVTAVVSGVNVATASSVGGAGDLTINPTVSGAGSLTKVGNGKLILTAANTYIGGTIANGGTLQVENATALGTGALTINNGATVTLGASSELSLIVAGVTWNGGGLFKYSLGSGGTSDSIITGGALTMGTAGAFNFDFSGTGENNATYTLITFASTTFVDPNQFGYANLGAASGHFVLDGTTLSFVTVPEPGTYALGVALVGFTLLRLRKRATRRAC